MEDKRYAHSVRNYKSSHSVQWGEARALSTTEAAAVLS